jgi:hypothetical protein
MMSEVRRPKSIKKVKQAGRLIKAMLSEVECCTKDGLQTMFIPWSDDPNSASEAQPLEAYKATSDPDTLYLHEAMKEPDK